MENKAGSSPGISKQTKAFSDQDMSQDSRLNFLVTFWHNFRNYEWLTRVYVF